MYVFRIVWVTRSWCHQLSTPPAQMLCVHRPTIISSHAVSVYMHTLRKAEKKLCIRCLSQGSGIDAQMSGFPPSWLTSERTSNSYWPLPRLLKCLAGCKGGKTPPVKRARFPLFLIIFSRCTPDASEVDTSSTKWMRVIRGGGGVTVEWSISDVCGCDGLPFIARRFDIGLSHTEWCE